MSEMPAREQMISAYSELVGLDPVSLGDGVAEVRLPMAAHLRNRGGVMHGGALFSLMDVTMGLACSSSHGFDRQSVTLECKINYIRAVADGEVRCVARVLHAGRRSLVVEAEVRQGDKLVAKGQGTFCPVVNRRAAMQQNGAQRRSRSVPGARLDGSRRSRGDRPQDEAKTHLRPPSCRPLGPPSYWGDRSGTRSQGIPT